MAKTLIVYYSWSNGNTEKIARQLQAATGADMMRIDTVTPYKGSHQQVVDQGLRETEQGYMPPIQPPEKDLSDYDTIIIGTPTWWYTMAPAVLTFLTENEWKGKTIIPFMTHGGWPGHVLKDMKKACAGAEFACEMEIQFDSQGGPKLVTAQSVLDRWIGQVQAFV